MSEPDHDVVRMHVAQALSRAVAPETVQHLYAALEELNQGDPNPPLSECPVCHRVGLPERVRADHDCHIGQVYRGP